MQKAINKYCPRSGKLVKDDSLTKYRGHVVGFCNPGCRDDFAKDIGNNQKDTDYFDIVIKENDHKLNKENAIAFYKMAYLGEPAKAVERYVGAKYIQHNSLVGDGKQAFIEYFSEMARDFPGKTIQFVRAVAEGDLVALHTHQTWPGNDQYVTMDFFRFDADGKIVEHWDAIQAVPVESKNGNSMY